ncbi:beta-lactamase [Flavobacteriaceae bacterium UJ101]|nr:beta-lactamase [Flavobacteriaceae bacterium UJ101]
MQKITLLILVTFSFITCFKEKKQTITKKYTDYQIIKPKFQSILDSANIKGAILIYDLEKGLYYSNDFKYTNEGKLPASTFKIANSIIALDHNIIKNDSTILKWNGEKRWMKRWEQDLTFKEAFHFSCVPCYQEIARKIGVTKMQEYLTKLNYGHINVDSTSIDHFWLEGASHINQMEQIDFLKRFYNSELPIKARTENIMKRMFIEEHNDEYQLSGKTGLSTINDVNNGWYVGYIETKPKTYFFATNIEPKKPFDFNSFIKKRKEVTLEALHSIFEENERTTKK